MRYYVNMVHHGKVPADSLVWVYYTRNRLPPHWNVIIEFEQGPVLGLVGGNSIFPV